MTKKRTKRKNTKKKANPLVCPGCGGKKTPRSKHCRNCCTTVGRPTKYRPEFCRKIIEYFNVPPVVEVTRNVLVKGEVKEIDVVEPNDLRFLEDFAWEVCGVPYETMVRWTHDYEEFRHAYARAKEFQARNLHICALRGFFNPIYARFTAINITDWKSEKAEIGIKELPAIQVQLHAGAVGLPSGEEQEELPNKPRRRQIPSREVCSLPLIEAPAVENATKVQESSDAEP